MISKNEGFSGPNTSDFAPHIILILFIALFGLLQRVRSGLKIDDWKMISFAVISIFIFLQTPWKEMRYLIYIFLPIGFYSTKFLMNISKSEKLKKRIITVALVFITYTATSAYIGLNVPKGFEQSNQMLKEDCMVMSNAWPLLNYRGIDTHPHPKKSDLLSRLRKGYGIILYKTGDIPKPDYINELSEGYGEWIIEDNDRYIYLGNNQLCATKERVDTAYLDYENDAGKDIQLCPIIPLFC